jgi:recombination protein RecR
LYLFIIHHSSFLLPMPFLPPALEMLVHELMRLPGIGRRGAERLALHLLENSPELARGLADSLTRLHQEVRACAECGNWSAGERCAICSDPRRDPQLLCVVEKPADLWAFEEARAFTGRYHVLGGALSPLGGITAEDLRIDSLERRIEGDNVTEVILATNPSVDGDATAHYLAHRLARPGLKLTRIAQGVPLGGALGYADAGTLRLALEGRRSFQ